MQHFFKSVATMTAVFAITFVPFLLNTKSASGDEGMCGSCVGVSADGSGTALFATVRID